jgi:hypothetical protein
VAARTFTYAWTQTRLESIQDQFRYFMTYGGIKEKDIDEVVYGVGEKAVQAVGIYGLDSSCLRVIEAELSVDWELSAKLTLSIPNISGGLTGWDRTQAPEVKVVGRRFAQAAERLQLTISYWVRFIPSVRDVPDSHKKWCDRLGLTCGQGPPGWKETPEERPETLLDIPEVQVSIRRAGQS